MHKRSKARAGGFTLIEALAAGMILAMFAAIIASSVSTSVAALSLASDQQRAADYLDQVLTRIDLLGPDRMARVGPTSGQLDEQFSWRASFEPMIEGYLYQVTVTIEWQTPQSTHSVSGYTMLNDPPNSRSASLRWDEL